MPSYAAILRSLGFSQQQIDNLINLSLNGTYAPADAQYAVATSNGSLTAERVLTNTTTVTWDFSTAGQAKANTSDASGSYTPTLTGVANAASTSGPTGVYLRSASGVSSTVTFSVTPSVGLTLTKVGISLPVVATLSSNLFGVATVVDGSVYIPAYVVYDNSNNRAELWFISATTGSHTVYAQFQYLV